MTFLFFVFANNMVLFFQTQTKLCVFFQVWVLFKIHVKKLIDSLILLSIGASDDESDTISLKEQDHRRQNQLQSDAKDAIEKACSMFESCGDIPNYALCEANMGRLFQVIGSCHRKIEQWIFKFLYESLIKVSVKVSMTYIKSLVWLLRQQKVQP